MHNLVTPIVVGGLALALAGCGGTATTANTSSTAQTSARSTSDSATAASTTSTTSTTSTAPTPTSGQEIAGEDFVAPIRTAVDAAKSYSIEERRST